MNESEFRDWVRAQIRAFDDRLKRAEAVPKAAIKAKEGLARNREQIAEGLVKAVKAGKVSSLAIVWVDNEHGPMTAWSVDGVLDKMTLMGAVDVLAQDLVAPQTEPPAEAAAA
jgi:hypothetical protein